MSYPFGKPSAEVVAFCLACGVTFDPVVEAVEDHTRETGHYVTIVTAEEWDRIKPTGAAP